jgi:hypothetical protein
MRTTITRAVKTSMATTKMTTTITMMTTTITTTTPKIAAMKKATKNSVTKTTSSMKTSAKRDLEHRLVKFKNLCREYKNGNIILRAELRVAKSPHTSTKRKMREQFEWDGEEAKLADKVAYYCKANLFPHYKVLKDKWTCSTKITRIAFHCRLLKSLRSPRMLITPICGVE